MADDDWLADDHEGGHVADEVGRRSVAERDMNKTHTNRRQFGYREGLQDARGDEACLQAGFDAGFADAAPVARLRGRIRGILQILVALLDKGQLAFESAEAGAEARARLLAAAQRLTDERWPREDPLTDEEAGIVASTVEHADHEDEHESEADHHHHAPGHATARAAQVAPSSGPVGASSTEPTGQAHGQHSSRTPELWRPAAQLAAAGHLQRLQSIAEDAEAAVRHIVSSVASVSASESTASGAKVSRTLSEGQCRRILDMLRAAATEVATMAALSTVAGRAL